MYQIGGHSSRPRETPPTTDNFLNFGSIVFVSLELPGEGSVSRRNSRLSQPETVSSFETVGSIVSQPLEFRLRGSQLPGSNGIGESAGLMGAVAERLVCGVPTTAEPNGGPTSQAKGFSLGIKNFEIAFHADGSIVIDSNFRGHHFLSWTTGSMPIPLCSDKRNEQRPGQAGALLITPFKSPQKNQYFGTDGSTSSDHARMPPFRLRTLRKPALRKKSTASAERFPLRQCATISRDESNSCTRRVSSPSGSRCPLRLQIWYSCGSRTSRMNKSSPRSSLALSSRGVISGTCTDGPGASSPRTPQNS